jgi:S1-C subfamily serine protease
MNKLWLIFSQAVSTKGILLSEALDSGSAFSYGAKPGNILIAIDGAPTNDARTLLDKVVSFIRGNEAKLKMLRKRKE